MIGLYDDSASAAVAYRFSPPSPFGLGTCARAASADCLQSAGVSPAVSEQREQIRTGGGNDRVEPPPADTTVKANTSVPASPPAFY